MTDPRPLLDLIIKHESEGAVKPQGVRSPYEVVYSGIPARHRPKHPLTTYPIWEVLQWQKWVVAKGSASTAAGAYQILRKTLLSLSPDPDAIFSAETQDALAVQLLERRGWRKFLARAKPLVSFGDSLAREWASLPVLRDQQGPNRWVRRGQSYYAGDGLNRAHAAPEEVESVLRGILTPCEPTPPQRLATGRYVVIAGGQWTMDSLGRLEVL